MAHSFESGWFVKQLKRAIATDDVEHVESTGTLDAYFRLVREDEIEKLEAFSTQRALPPTPGEQQKSASGQND